MKMRIAALLALLGIVAMPSQTLGAEVIKQTNRGEYDVIVDNPCTGEQVRLTGEVISTSIVVYDDQGFPLHESSAFALQGVTGIGLTSGELYRSAGGTRGGSTYGAGQGAEVQRNVSSFVLISPGGGSNLVGHTLFRETVAPGSGVTGVVEIYSVKCVG